MFLLKLIEFVVNALIWFWIVFSPVLLSIGLSVLVFLFWVQGLVGILISVFLVLCGISLGYIVNNRAIRSGGYVKFMSRIMETPEIAPHD